MKKFLVAVLLVSILSTACSMGAPAEPTATAVPPPTNTAPPTETPLPTDTPTPVYTPTPDAAATAAAQATASASTVLDELSKLFSDTDVPYKDGHLLWQQTEAVTIHLQGPSGDDTVAEIDKNITAADFIFKSDVTWEATGWMFCGGIFRSEANLDKGKQYQLYFLRLSGLPAWYISAFEGTSFLGSISGEQFSDAIDMKSDATNEFVLVAQDNAFNVYFNGISQGRYFDNKKQLSEGRFGFMAWQESGKGSCKFENSWIWSLDK